MAGSSVPSIQVEKVTSSMTSETMTLIASGNLAPSTTSGTLAQYSVTSSPLIATTPASCVDILGDTCKYVVRTQKCTSPEVLKNCRRSCGCGLSMPTDMTESPEVTIPMTSPSGTMTSTADCVDVDTTCETLKFTIEICRATESAFTLCRRTCGLCGEILPEPMTSFSSKVATTTEDLPCGAHKFRCASGNCIDAQWRCDAVEDCLDGSDERGCDTNIIRTIQPLIPAATTVKPSTVRPTELKTSMAPSSMMSTSSWVVTSSRDCFDSIVTCESLVVSVNICNDTKSAHTQCRKTCGLCGGISTVMMTSAIHVHSTDQHTCTQQEFRCGMGSCIPLQWRCDSVEDCGDGSDEKACSTNIKTIQPLIDMHSTPASPSSSSAAAAAATTTTTIATPMTTLPIMTSSSSHVSLTSSSDCLDLNSTCDVLITSIDICNDTEYALKLCRKSCNLCDFDSTETTTSAVLQSTKIEPATCQGFLCGNGHCLPETFHCDGMNDCSDGSDETGCESHTCNTNEFQCQSGSCVPNTWRCDAVEDCSDGSDEKGCSRTGRSLRSLVSLLNHRRRLGGLRDVSSTENCQDEFNDEICDFLKPQCHEPDIARKCRSKCGYCNQAIPVTPCSGTCCDEMSAEFCVFANQCDSYSVALKCQRTCGLCTSDGAVTTTPDAKPGSAVTTSPDATSGGAHVLGDHFNSTVLGRRQIDTSTRPSLTGSQDCVDEFNDEICDYLQPQCYNPDIIMKCRKKCGYCDKDIPIATTQKTFTYSPGTVPHVTVTPGGATIPAVTTNGLTFAPSSAPCSGTCCDEMSAEFCVFANQCDSYSVALKCQRTCGLCTPDGAVTTTPDATSVSTGTTDTPSTLTVLSSSIMSTNSLRPSVKIARMTSVCEDADKDICMNSLIQCSDPVVAQRCQKTCQVCSTNNMKVAFRHLEDDKHEIKKRLLVQGGQTSCSDEADTSFCQFMSDQCSSYAVRSKCLKTCNSCNLATMQPSTFQHSSYPQFSGSTFSSGTTTLHPATTKPTLGMTTLSSATVQPAAGMTTIQPITSQQTAGSCEDAISSQFCSLITNQCYSYAVAVNCRQTCNSCHLSAPSTGPNVVTADTQPPGVFTTGNGVTTGSGSASTAAPATLVCNKMTDAQTIIADPVNRVCYYHFTQGEKVADAKARCERVNLHLVHLETEEEELFLNGKLQAAGHADQFWLGLEKIGGHWFWVDGPRHIPVTSETHWEGSDGGTYAYNTPPDHWKSATDSMYYKAVCEDNTP